MKGFTKFYQSVFGHNRSERRSSIVLLVLLVVVIIARLLFPKSTVTVGGNPIIIEPDTVTIVSEPTSVASREPIQPGGQVPVKDNKIRRIELNSCDSASLESLPGLGPVLSARIVKFRNLLGGFYSVEQLKEVYGLDEETYDMVADFFTVDTSLISRVKVREAGYRELIRIPYLTKEEVNSILRFKEISGGSISSADELVKNGVISAETSLKVDSYLDFE